MVKYSFIVPVYNTSKYLEKCLLSLVNQTYNDFEIIVVNDGSTDNSLEIINKYNNKNIIVLNQENKGLSVARNNGVKKANGKYLLFIDSDDYVEKDLLEKIDKEIDCNEILRYQIITEGESGDNKRKYSEKGFNTRKGYEAFKCISNYHFIEPACCYVYDKDYYINNNFKFKENMYHEDYGLIPYVIYKATKVKSIDYAGYHYVQRKGSIMNNTNYDKTIKKAFDMLNQYKVLRLFSKNVNKKNNYDDYYLSYITNCVIVKAKELKYKERKLYIKELKKIKAIDGILVDTLIRKLKKTLMKLNLGLYIRMAK